MEFIAQLALFVWAIALAVTITVLARDAILTRQARRRTPEACLSDPEEQSA